MTSEAADTTTIQEALDMYVRSLKSGSRSKGKSSSAKPIDHKALYEFVKYFPPTACLQKLTPSDIGQYAEKVNGTGTTPGATAQLQAVKDFLAYAKKNEGLTEENLARYVRIRKARSRAGATVVSTESQTIELTSEGHAQLVSQRERLVQESESLVEEIRRARADGDVTENSPLDAAREEQGRVEARIQEITSTLDKSVHHSRGTNPRQKSGEDRRARRGEGPEQQSRPEDLYACEQDGSQPPGLSNIRRFADGQGTARQACRAEIAGRYAARQAELRGCQHRVAQASCRAEYAIRMPAAGVSGRFECSPTLPRQFHPLVPAHSHARYLITLR